MFSEKLLAYHSIAENLLHQTTRDKVPEISSGYNTIQEINTFVDSLRHNIKEARSNLATASREASIPDEIKSRLAEIESRKQTVKVAKQISELGKSVLAIRALTDQGEYMNAFKLFKEQFDIAQQHINVRCVQRIFLDLKKLKPEIISKVQAKFYSQLLDSKPDFSVISVLQSEDLLQSTFENLRYQHLLFRRPKNYYQIQFHKINLFQTQ